MKLARNNKEDKKILAGRYCQTCRGLGKRKKARVWFELEGVLHYFCRRHAREFDQKIEQQQTYLPFDMEYPNVFIKGSD